MGSKGTGDCCCGGCSEPPWDRENPSRQNIQLLQQFCCACVPKQLCVTYECGYELVTGMIPLVRPCTDGDYLSVYRGDIPINGELVDIELAFQVDEYAQKCYLCLTSYGLGISAECNEITDTVRRYLCPRCQRCPEQDGSILEWSLPGCAGSPSRLFITGAANTSIPPLPLAESCPDPCYEADPGTACGGVCAGCSCICSNACITVIRGNAVYLNEIVSLCAMRYRASNGFEISITAEPYSNCCQLEITDLADIQILEPLGTPDPVRIGGATNPCPSPTARWDFTDYELPFPDNHVQVIFECAPCLECAGVLVTQCCPNNVTRLPNVLYADVDGGPYCCGSFTLPLIFSPIEQAWIGYDGNAMCDHEIRLRLVCDVEHWTLTFSGSPCTEISVEPYSATCEPLDLKFNVTANGIGCCGGFGSGNLIVTITE